MYLSIVTDEISSDPLTAVELATEWDIRHFELRNVGSGRLPNISDADRRRLRSLASRDDISLTAMSPGFFKDRLDSDTTPRQLAEGLPRAIDLAKELGIPKMVVFSCRKESGMSRSEGVRRVAELLAGCAATLADAGIELLVENEHICWGDTGPNTVEILDAAGHPNLSLNWDPCNGLWAGGGHFPDDYDRVKDRIGNVHVKDTLRNRVGEFRGVPIGEGEVQWREILPALIRDGWRGPFCVETHYSPKVAGSRICAENLKRLLIEAV
jgi:sugar phosphate isomerase/epimerase